MKKGLVLIIFATILFGCAPSINQTNQKTTIDSPDIGIPITPNGEAISIQAPEGWNSFKVGKPVVLWVHNLSNEQIVFKYNLGAKIYVLQEDEWIEVQDNSVPPDTDNIILESNKNFDVFKAYTLFLLPGITNPTDVVSLRIFVAGSVYKDGQVGDQQLATYIDLQLEP